MTSNAPRPSALLLTLALAGLSFWTGGCRSDSTPNTEIADPACAECPVCKAEGDLACVKVHVRAGTPCSCHCGCTYYFCSDDCKKQFDRTPKKYLGH